jgi:hypothetical protein
VIDDEVPRRAVDDQMWEAYLSRLRPEVSSFERELRPDSTPAFSDLVIGEDQVWALHYPAPGGLTNEWSVYVRRTGERITTMSFPREFRLLDVTRTLALGVSRSDMGVESIVAYRLP